MRIEAIVPEVFLIARELKKLPPAEFQELLSKLDKHAEAASGVLMEDFFLPCPLLQDGVCSIYPIRPAMCRKYCSLDVEECKNPDKSAPENGELFTKSAALLLGTTAAYGRANLTNHSHELGQALRLALIDETAELRWYNGASVFEPIPEQDRYGS